MTGGRFLVQRQSVYWYMRRYRAAERRRTVLLAIAGMLLQAVLVLFGLLWAETAPTLALGYVCFAIISTAGSGAIAIVYAQKGGADQNGCVN